MVKTDKKCKILAGKIERFFESGLYLSTDVLHFIDSTFLSPSMKAFGSMLADELNVEREVLMELIFSPDESLQIELESSLPAEGFDKSDERQILDLLWSKRIGTCIIFPDGRGELELGIPREALAAFVQRLRLHRKPDPVIVLTLERCVDQRLKENGKAEEIDRLEYTKAAILVRLRNRTMPLSRNKRKCLCRFLECVDWFTDDFFPCFDFLLEAMESADENQDLRDMFCHRKRIYHSAIEKQEDYENLLRKSNRETLHLRGVRAPFVNVDKMQKRIQMIDGITLAVYGKIVYLDDLPAPGILEKSRGFME